MKPVPRLSDDALTALAESWLQPDHPLAGCQLPEADETRRLAQGVRDLLTARDATIRALNEIGASTADGIGELTLAGRCWALSHRWSGEQEALEIRIQQLEQDLASLHEGCDMLQCPYETRAKSADALLADLRTLPRKQAFICESVIGPHGGGAGSRQAAVIEVADLSRLLDGDPPA